MNYSYIIIDDDPESVLKTKAITANFSELHFIAEAYNYADALNLIIEHSPKLIFIEIDPVHKKSKLSLNLIDTLYRYLTVIPKIIITTSKKDLAYEAIQYEVTDYLIKPLKKIDFKKLILKLKKIHWDDEIFIIQSPHHEENSISTLSIETSHKKKNHILCIKSYGDHRYIDSKDICYLQADNNSTDIHLNNGEVVTAFKTLKHFEAVLSTPFVRIHNSFIINRNYIARIHTGNSVCYIKNTTIKLPFSKSYKKNIDFIISDFSNENYIEV
ncbi:LytR/AlgR family response regulator transcription factor [Flavobacterium aestivum]|uniref:LytR/AlgR family response regulator transcription factor n=1 Tax=Flavobacterium aestivum TaxID=3003257 RepID=UPI002483134F|nr:LytTR family transcriptional regulator DNA-binding domain-containing protein [Flavobacterium aestivum]